MTTDPRLILAQWLSPAYPVGAFSYSHGIEATVLSGAVHDASGFQDWLHDVLAHGAGRNDVILLAAAFRADSGEALQEIDDLAIALSPSRERLLETTQQGAAFSRTTRDVFGPALAGLADLAYPVAVGRAAALHGLPLSDTARFFIHAFAASLTSAAVRLVPLGQTEGQRVLHNLTPLTQNIADAAIHQTLDDIGASAFAIDIASMTHETQYSRLFRS